MVQRDTWKDMRSNQYVTTQNSLWVISVRWIVSNNGNGHRLFT